MKITTVNEEAEVGQPFFRFLCSDFHLGSQCADHELIVGQLQRAKNVGARVLINGDVFDAIGPKDKRFDLQVLHPSVARCKDLAKAVVDMAKELLTPFAEIIDLIGIGNHEETWINYGYNDPVQRLIEELNREGGSIQHASVMGFVRTAFKVAGVRKRLNHRLFYLHGTGGDSPVTKGTIDFNRKGRNWNYDTLTFGHKHNYVCSADQIAEVSEEGKYSERRQLNLQTGSYYRNYRELKKGEILDYSYAARSAHPPKPLGGVFLCMTPEVHPVTGDLHIKQDFMSDVVVPWSKRKRAS